MPTPLEETSRMRIAHVKILIKKIAAFETQQAMAEQQCQCIWNMMSNDERHSAIAGLHPLAPNFLTAYFEEVRFAAREEAES